uniref:Uncharacterized protein n=1 Tax=viral metagenome TaxID=1070528 RepID=A0A6C0KJR3_9ZZZZ
MAEAESILIPDKIDQLSFMDKITHLGKQFTPDEKKKWWDKQPGKRHKIGLIRNKELDTAIQIFTESFDLSKKLKNHEKLTQSFETKTCSDVKAFRGVRPSLSPNTGQIFSAGIASGIAAESLVKSGIPDSELLTAAPGEAALVPAPQLGEASLVPAPQLGEASLVPAPQLGEASLVPAPQAGEPQPSPQDTPSHQQPEPALAPGETPPHSPLQEEEQEDLSVDSGSDANDEREQSQNPSSEDEEYESNQTNVESVETSNRSNANSLKGGFRNGFNRSGNLTTPEVLEQSLETIGSATDFERLYLGWLNDPKLPKQTDIDLQIRKNSLKSLFRFVFGKKSISDVTATTFQKKLRIAYTPLTTEEKVPCKAKSDDVETQQRTIWEDFHESLKYRRKQAMCELFAARDIVGEDTLYVSQKKKLILGLRDLIDIMERTIYPCMEYGYDVTQHEPEEPELLTEEEYARLLAVFRTFVKDRKIGEDGYSYNMLRKKLSKKEKTTEKSEVLYNQLLELLVWMKGEAEAQERMKALQVKITELETLSKGQKEDIRELEELVLILIYILNLTEKMHVLQLKLEEMTCTVKECCRKKINEAKQASLPNSVKNLLDSVKNYKKEYDVIRKKLEKEKDEQGVEIQELQDIILALTSILLSIDRFHQIDKSLARVEEAIRKCIEKKEEVKELIERLQRLQETTSKSTTSTAIQTVSDTAIELANKTLTDLDKKEAELRSIGVGTSDVAVDSAPPPSPQQVEKPVRNNKKDRKSPITPDPFAVVSESIRDTENNNNSFLPIAKPTSVTVPEQPQQPLKNMSKGSLLKMQLPNSATPELREGNSSNDIQENVRRIMQLKPVASLEAEAEAEAETSTVPPKLIIPILDSPSKTIDSLLKQLKGGGNIIKGILERDIRAYAVKGDSNINDILKDSPIMNLINEYQTRAQFWRGAQLTETYSEQSPEQAKQYFTIIVNSIWKSFKNNIRGEDNNKEFFRKLIFDLFRTYVMQFQLIEDEPKIIDEYILSNKIDKAYKDFDFYIGSIPLTTEGSQTVFTFLDINKEKLRNFVIGTVNTPKRFYRKGNVFVGGGDGADGDNEDNNNKYNFCKTMLAALMVEASKHEGFDYKEFMRKANTTLEELGQCPLVTKALGYLMDESMNQSAPEEGYTFIPLGESPSNNQEFIRALEKSYTTNFTETEKAALQSLAPPFILHANSPEEFQDVLGRNSYFLNGSTNAENEDIPLYGVGEDDIFVTPEERKIVEKGGIPTGGILVLYLIAGCKRDDEDLNTGKEKDTNED